tara:strand:+ start:119 stop:235 length:117 start_codon:yes stop_codon:yes gene_type:complete
MKKLLIDMDGVLVDFGKKVNEIDYPTEGSGSMIPSKYI